MNKVNFLVRENLDKEDLINWSSGTALIKSDPFVKFQDLLNIRILEKEDIFQNLSNWIETNR